MNIKTKWLGGRQAALTFLVALGRANRFGTLSPVLQKVFLVAVLLVFTFATQMDIGEEFDFDTYLSNSYEQISSLLSTHDSSLGTQICMHDAMLKWKLFWHYGRMKNLIQAVEQGKIAVAKTSEQHKAFTEGCTT